MGNVYKTLLKYNEAKENYEKALSINPNFMKVIANLGNLYFELNDILESNFTNEKSD